MKTRRCLFGKFIATASIPSSRSHSYTSYTKNNDYIGFKKLVYDAQFPGDDAPPMPHSSTWFPDQSRDSSDPNTGGPAAAVGSEADSNDDDLAVASERISIKCPITLLTMKDPVTSTKCPHNFEREAILSMINASEVRVDGSGIRGAGGKKAMQCPVCTVVSLPRPCCYFPLFQGQR